MTVEFISSLEPDSLILGETDWMSKSVTVVEEVVPCGSGVRDVEVFVVDLEEEILGCHENSLKKTSAGIDERGLTKVSLAVLCLQPIKSSEVSGCDLR